MEPRSFCLPAKRLTAGPDRLTLGQSACGPFFTSWVTAGHEIDSEAGVPFLHLSIDLVTRPDLAREK